MIVEDALELNDIGLSELGQPQWKEQLYSAFLEELSGVDGVFLPALGQRLEEISRTGGDIAAFHKLITRFWRLARRRLQPGSPEWSRADTLLHAARVKTSGSAERAPAREQVRFEDAAHKLTWTSNALSGVVDNASLSAVLARQLPEQSIDACYVCLYDTEGSSRLVAGFESSAPLSLPADGLRFPTSAVLPNGALGLTPACWYLVGPLSRGGDSPGYVVFRCGDSLGGPIACMENEHDMATRTLQKMRELTDCYTAPLQANATWCEMLEGLTALDRDLREHMYKENKVLFPRALARQSGARAQATAPSPCH